MEGKDIAKISLKVLNVALKTFQAQSPEMENLKSDLGKVVEVLQYGGSRDIIECNRYLTRKYLLSPSQALKYNLQYTTEMDFIQSNPFCQRLALYQIGCFLKDMLNSETTMTKVSTALVETAKEVMSYGMEKFLGNPKPT